MRYQSSVFGSLLALSVACGAAQAAPIQFTYTATVTGTNYELSGVQVGTVFTGTFSYDTATPASTNSLPPHFNFYSLPAAYQMTANVAGHQVVARNVSVTIYDNLNGNVEDGISLEGSALTLDGAPLDNGALYFNLTTRPGNTGVVTGPALPSSINVAAFDGDPSLTYGGLQRDGGPTGPILGFKVNSITPTSDCSVSYKVTGNTKSTFDAAMTVTNSATASATGWAVNWVYTPITITANIKNAQLAQKGHRTFTATPVTKNKTIAANGATTFSFTGSKLQGALPVLSNMTATLGGKSCQVSQ